MEQKTLRSYCSEARVQVVEQLEFHQPERSLHVNKEYLEKVLREFFPVQEGERV